MSDTKDAAERYAGAAMLLPRFLRETAMALSEDGRSRAEELRLRTGRRLSVLLPNGERELSGETIRRSDLDGMLELATGASAHTARDAISAGYVTVAGGYRIGLCGTAAVRGGAVTGFRFISSAAIRVSRQIVGAADGVVAGVCNGGTVRSTLVISPPGAGKTTLLRDIVRTLSRGGSPGIPGFRIALADERGEVAAMLDGQPQMDVGPRTDVLDSCPKAEAVMMLLRSMNPQVVALDEITAPDDVRAIKYAANCGVKLLATAHADTPDDLRARPIYRELLEAGIFEKAVVIRKENGARVYELIDLRRTVW
ncbi:MAG: stage III sporulation protein AB [Oscillospiraceae bacterium]|nr:stage III sporulation protein AB [Oscillospiraceae bacterium]